MTVKVEDRFVVQQQHVWLFIELLSIQGIHNMRRNETKGLEDGCQWIDTVGALSTNNKHVGTIKDKRKEKQQLYCYTDKDKSVILVRNREIEIIEIRYSYGIRISYQTDYYL